MRKAPRGRPAQAKGIALAISAREYHEENVDGGGVAPGEGRFHAEENVRPEDVGDVPWIGPKENVDGGSALPGEARPRRENTSDPETPGRSPRIRSEENADCRDRSPQRSTSHSSAAGKW